MQYPLLLPVHLASLSRGCRFEKKNNTMLSVQFLSVFPNEAVFNRTLKDYQPPLATFVLMPQHTGRRVREIRGRYDAGRLFINNHDLAFRFIRPADRENIYLHNKPTIGNSRVKQKFFICITSWEITVIGPQWDITPLVSLNIQNYDSPVTRR